MVLLVVLIVAMSAAGVLAVKVSRRDVPSWVERLVDLGHQGGLIGQVTFDGAAANVAAKVAQVLPNDNGVLVGAEVLVAVPHAVWERNQESPGRFKAKVDENLVALGARPGSVRVRIVLHLESKIVAELELPDSVCTVPLSSGADPASLPSATPGRGAADAGSTGDASEPRLVATARFARGDEVELRDGDLLVWGRGIRSCDVAITGDDTVSDPHAQLEVSAADGVTITDLNSRNGVIVNGYRRSVCRLVDGDTFVLGETMVQLRFECPVGAGRIVHGGATRPGDDADVESTPVPENARAEDSSDASAGAARVVDLHALTEPLESPTWPQTADRPTDDTTEPTESSSDPGVARPLSVLRLPPTAPLRSGLAAPLIGRTRGGTDVAWPIADGQLPNLNVAIFGQAGTGKSELAKSLITQLSASVAVTVIDPKGEYAPLADLTHYDPWTSPLPFNPLRPIPGPSRGGERLVIEIRDALEEACRPWVRLGAHQLSRVECALADAASTEGVTMADLHATLDVELRAILGDLTGRNLFGDGPSPGALLHSRCIIDLAALPGDGRTTAMFTALVLAAISQQLAVEPHVPDAFRSFLVVDEAHRLTRQRALTLAAREGRSRGLGVGLVTQTPDDVPDAVLAQAGTLVCFALPGGAARDAADWLGRPALADTIRALPPGRALVRFGHQEPVEVTAMQHHRNPSAAEGVA